MPKSIARLNIRQKVALLFALLLGTIGIVAYLTIAKLAAINVAAVYIGNTVLPATQIFGDLADATQHFRLLQAEHVFVVAPAEMDRIEQDMHETDGKVRGLLDRLATLATPDQAAALDDFHSGWADFARAGDSLAQMSRNNDDTLVGKLYRNDAARLFERLRADLKIMSAANVDTGNAAAETSIAIIKRTQWQLGLALGVAVILCIATILYFRRAVMLPIMRTAALMQQLAADDLEVEIIGAERRDEIGTMMVSLIVFRDSILESHRLHAARAAEQEERTRSIEQSNRLSQDFSRAVDQALQELGAATQGLGQTADDLSADAEIGVSQAQRVAHAAESASENVGTVASATEQLAASIREVTNQATQSSAVATEAVNEAAHTLTIVADLTQAATRIGNIVEMINDIASQTHLLALNAAIEAARAGDAGRGFAVVAAEVRSLAGETGRATEEIAAQVTMMQTAAQHAVDAIGRIDKTITRMSDVSGAIVTVIDQQQTATAEIARNVQEAARRTAEVSQNIANLNNVTNRTGSSSAAVLSAVQKLRSRTVGLRQDVDTYLATIGRH